MLVGLWQVRGLRMRGKPIPPDWASSSRPTYHSHPNPRAPQESAPSFAHCTVSQFVSHAR